MAHNQKQLIFQILEYNIRIHTVINFKSVEIKISLVIFSIKMLTDKYCFINMHLKFWSIWQYYCENYEHSYSLPLAYWPQSSVLGNGWVILPCCCSEDAGRTAHDQSCIYVILLVPSLTHLKAEKLEKDVLLFFMLAVLNRLVKHI